MVKLVLAGPTICNNGALVVVNKLPVSEDVVSSVRAPDGAISTSIIVKLIPIANKRLKPLNTYLNVTIINNDSSLDNFVEFNVKTILKDGSNEQL